MHSPCASSEIASRTWSAEPATKEGEPAELQLCAMGRATLAQLREQKQRTRKDIMPAGANRTQSIRSRYIGRRSAAGRMSRMTRRCQPCFAISRHYLSRDVSITRRNAGFRGMQVHIILTSACLRFSHRLSPVLARSDRRNAAS